MDGTRRHSHIWLGLLTAASLLAFPAAAAGDGTVAVAGSALRYTGSVSTASIITVSNPVAGTARFQELGSGHTLTPGAGCAAVTAQTVDCSTTAITGIEAELSPFQDAFFNSYPLPVTVDGLAGNDDLGSSAAGQSDSFTGGDGTDTLSYELHAQGVTANLATGTVTGPTAGADTVAGVESVKGSDGGHDVFVGSAGNDNFYGFRGNDSLSGGGGSDVLLAYEGDDVVDGGPGPDSMQGMEGADTVSFASEAVGVTVNLTGGSAVTSTGTDGILTFEDVVGSPSDDDLRGTSGPNALQGGAGTDQLVGLAGADHLDGGAGTDTAHYDLSTGAIDGSLAAGTVIAAEGNDTLAALEALVGSPHADRLTGDGGTNSLRGGVGDDVLAGGAGNDSLDGGSGDDTASYAAESEGGVTGDTGTGSASGGSSGTDTLAQIESFEGSSFDDYFVTLDGVAGSVDCGAGTGDRHWAEAADASTACEIVAPRVVEAPTIVGPAEAGATLTPSAGTWAGSAPTTRLYEWRRCADDGTGCVAIGGATNEAYTVSASDVGSTLRVRVRAMNDAGWDDGESPATAVVAAAPAGSGTQTGDGTATSSAPATASPSQAAPAPQQQQQQAAVPPQFARTVNVAPVSGAVLVREPGSDRFVPLTGPDQVRVGTVVDARRGRVRLTTTDALGRVHAAEFHGGMFRIVQLASAGGVTELQLVGGRFARCPTPASRSGARPSARRLRPSHSVRRLWGTGKGLFRTRGRYSTAAVRGTTWLTDDRCAGTLTRVTEGAVNVRDLVLRRTVVVRPGRSYLARPRR